MKAYELLAKLRILTLSGKGEDGFEWVGSDKQWKELEREEESILRDHELKKI